MQQNENDDVDGINSVSDFTLNAIFASMRSGLKILEMEWHMLDRFGLQQRHTIILLIAAITLVLSLFYVADQWQHDWHLTHQPITPLHLTHKETKVPKPISEAHLFGQSLETMGNAPFTSLQLHLTGISKVNDEQHDTSKATIAIGDAASKLYQVGDSLPYGVKVYAITNHLVLLDNGGHIEKLSLERSQLAFKPRNQTELGS